MVILYSFKGKETHPLVISRLDYANAVLYGVTKSTLDRLQTVQNSAAKLIMSSRTGDHATPILKQLHWLPVESRIQYKVLLLTYNMYNALHSKAPPYIYHCTVRFDLDLSIKLSKYGVVL